jgi:hypothetical protein
MLLGDIGIDDFSSSGGLLFVCLKGRRLFEGQAGVRVKRIF